MYVFLYVFMVSLFLSSVLSFARDLFISFFRYVLTHFSYFVICFSSVFRLFRLGRFVRFFISLSSGSSSIIIMMYWCIVAVSSLCMYFSIS